MQKRINLKMLKIFVWNLYTSQEEVSIINDLNRTFSQMMLKSWWKFVCGVVNALAYLRNLLW